MSDHFDLVVVGSGPAGEKGAVQAAYFGKRVCLVERAPKPGGAAVNLGTIAARALGETARYVAGMRSHAGYGVAGSMRPGTLLADFLYRERDTVAAEWSRIEENLRAHEVTTMQGTGTFVNQRLLEVEHRGLTRRISADVYLIATGASPHRPASIPFDDERVVDYESVLRLTKIPDRLVVIGGGATECEYAASFAALGVRVTLVTGRERLVSALDGEVSTALRDRLTGRFGVSTRIGTLVTGVRVEGQEAIVSLADDTTVSGDCVLYGNGREGNTRGLGLERAGVHTRERGYIEVDERFRTSVPFIFAAGDVLGFPPQASVAIEQARVAVCHAFDLRYKQHVSPIAPRTVWSIPEISMVGETEESARAKGISYEVGRASFGQSPRGQLAGDTDGFIKLLFRPEDQRLLGVSILGEGASELIHVGMTVIALGGTIDTFIQSVYNYPSLGDVYKYAAYDGLQRLARRVSGAMRVRGEEHPAVTS